MNNRFEEAIKQMEEMVLNLKEKASAKLEALSDDDGQMVKNITEKTVTAINTAINKVKEVANSQINEEEFNSFLEKVVNKCNDAATFTANKIEELKNKVIESLDDNKPAEEEIKEAVETKEAVEIKEAVETKEEATAEEVEDKLEVDLSKIKADIKEGLDKLMENENVQNFASSLKELSTKIQDYLNSPEIQSKIDKAKDTTIDIAEKGLDVLRNVLKADEAPKAEEPKKDEDDIVYLNKKD